MTYRSRIHTMNRNEAIRRVKIGVTAAGIALLGLGFIVPVASAGNTGGIKVPGLYSSCGYDQIGRVSYCYKGPKTLRACVCTLNRLATKAYSTTHWAPVQESPAYKEPAGTGTFGQQLYRYVPAYKSPIPLEKHSWIFSFEEQSTP